MNKGCSPDELRRIIKQNRLRQNDIAKAIGLSQGQVSRLVSGYYKKPGRAYHNLCKYVINDSDRCNSVDISGNHELLDALSSVWDGSDEQARYLAQVIRSLAPLCQSRRAR